MIITWRQEQGER